MVNDYFSTLKRMRQSFGKETENLSLLESTQAPTQPTTRGLMERPKSSTNLRKVQTKQGIESSFSSVDQYVQEMQRIKKIIKEQSRGSSVVKPKSTHEESLFELAQEELKKKTEKTHPEPYRPSPRQTVEEVSDKLRAAATTIQFELPTEVKQDRAFMSEVDRLSNKYDISANELLALMSFETRGTFDPSIRNPQKGQTATGLIQFVEKTAKGLGTSTQALSEMSRVEQMKYVEKYFDQYADRIRGGSKEDLYMAVIWPAAIGKEKDYVLFREGEQTYSVNSGLDLNKDGVITKQEAAKRAFA